MFALFLMQICRLNWHNGDYVWTRNNYGSKYWPKNTQLSSVQNIDNKIKGFPKIMIQVLMFFIENIYDY